ncbi:pilus assembly protein TadG-related protein [Gimesia algae]|uniref:Uncharacterized protein n=1 Tax=Gimesia algae TaxID=2527971 RepID=A0A517VBU1_9PLAN|nr:pilus assembly protein TadG-related protein [Gimesia algae]QDT90474.1 hypothetical protein Pan161_21260 [Gimesia algae]
MKRIHTEKKINDCRRGIAVLWLVIWGSLFLTFFCVVLEIANLWQAHVELKNALDAAALAAVKEWGAEGSTLTEDARNSGVTYAAANTVTGKPVVLDPNYDPIIVSPPDPNLNPNQNASCDGNLVFGRITIPGALPEITFNSSLDVNVLGVLPAVRAQATVEVESFCSTLFGFSLFDVSAKSTAYYDILTGEVALVTIDTYTCN